MKRFLQAVTFYLLLPWLYLIALLPFSLLYGLSWLTFVLVYYVVRYRRTVVWENLCDAFPEKKATEHQRICKAFYRYLCDLVLEHIKMLTITKKQALRRCQFHNLEVFQQLYAQKRHVIVVMGHLGNWEWAGNSMALQTDYALCAIYMPLSNPYFNRFVYRLRARFGRRLIQQSDTLRAMLSYDATPKVTAFLADQAPPKEHAYVTNFLNQPTYVFKGIAKIAQKLNHAVVYASVRSIRRGYYKIYLELLFKNPSSMQENEISEAHTRKLEEDICRQPATWLWSHRRWKHKVIG